MKILLFGKNGQVGWELNKVLPRIGEVIALSRQDVDFSRPDELRNVVKQHEPDVIVNAAAYTAVDKAEAEEELALLVNGFAPGVLAEEALNIGALLVHFSTDYVFDGENEAAYSELENPNPINAYGRSKLAGERAIQGAGCDYLILRTSWVYSSRGSNFFLTIVKLAQSREKLTVVADQVGAPTWARLIADGTMKMLEKSMQERGAGTFTSDVYHLTSRGKTSWFGFAREIFTDGGVSAIIKGRPLPLIEPITTEQYPTPAMRPKNSSLDVSKFESRFGMRMPEWDQSLHQFMQTVA